MPRPEYGWHFILTISNGFGDSCQIYGSRLLVGGTWLGGFDNIAVVAYCWDVDGWWLTGGHWWLTGGRWRATGALPALPQPTKPYHWPAMSWGEALKCSDADFPFRKPFLRK